MSNSSIKYEEIKTKSVRHNDVSVTRNGKTEQGKPISGFEYLDRLHKQYYDAKSGETIDFWFSAGIAPEHFGRNFVNSVVERSGVIVGTDVTSLGLPYQPSAQASMRRAQTYIEYGTGATPAQIKAADRLIGVTHAKYITPGHKPDPNFKKFLVGVFGDALRHQLSLSAPTEADRDFTTKAWRNHLKKIARCVKFQQDVEVEVQKKDQNTSLNPKKRKEKEKGKGSHSRGTEKVVVKDYNGKFNISSDYLGPTHPPYDYEKNGEQIVIILNESNPSVKSALDGNNPNASPDKKISKVLADMTMEGARWAVNRETGKVTEKQWQAYTELHGTLSCDDEFENVVRLKKVAI